MIIKVVFSTFILVISASSHAEVVLGDDLAGHSALAGAYATFGAGANVSGDISSDGYVTLGANSVVTSIYGDTITLGATSTADTLNGNNFVLGAGAVFSEKNTADHSLFLAFEQLHQAKQELFELESDAVFAATLGSTTFRSGIYEGTALTTAAQSLITLDGQGQENPFWVFNIDTYFAAGAGTEIEIINSGVGASVVWNTGSYVSLGADTSFIGAILAGGYVSAGDGSNIPCGNVYTSSYVSVAAGSELISSNCAGVGSWAGSLTGVSLRQLSVSGEPEPYVDTQNDVASPMVGILAMLGFVIMVNYRRFFSYNK